MPTQISTLPTQLVNFESANQVYFIRPLKMSLFLNCCLDTGLGLKNGSLIEIDLYSNDPISIHEKDGSITRGGGNKLP